MFVFTMHMTSICEKKKFGRSAAYSCTTNVFIEFHHFVKKEWTQLQTKQLKQNIFTSMRIYGFSKTELSHSFVIKITTIVTRYPTFKKIKSPVTGKPLFRRKWTFLDKLDLSEAIKWPLFKSLSLQLWICPKFVNGFFSTLQVFSFAQKFHIS